MAKQYSIAGIHVTPTEYQRLEFIITNEKQAGWQPTKADIRTLIHSDRHPSKELKQDMKTFDKMMKKDE